MLSRRLQGLTGVAASVVVTIDSVETPTSPPNRRFGDPSSFSVSPIPRRPGQRHRLLEHLPGSVGQFLLMANRRRVAGWAYVGIGSNSNITERGMDAETDRARVWQIDARS